MSINRDYELRSFYECGQLVNPRPRHFEDDEEEILYGCDREHLDDEEVGEVDQD